MRNIIINVFEKGGMKKPKDKGKKKRIHFGYCIGLPRTKKERTPSMLEITITNEQEIDVTLKPVTETGKPASVDGKPTWTVISGSSTVERSEDGLSAILRSSDDPGDTEIMVKADADLGEGEQEISDIISLHVSGANAANLGLSAGTPRAKTAPPV